MKSRQEYTETVTEAGINLADTWITAAIKSSDTDDQMMTHMAVLQIAAIHVLATAAFNFEMQQGLPSGPYFDAVSKELKARFEELTEAHANGEMKLERLGCDA